MSYLANPGEGVHQDLRPLLFEEAEVLYPEAGGGLDNRNLLPTPPP